MQFVWNALLPTTVSLQGNSSALGSGSRHNAQRSPRFAEAEQITIIAEFVEAETGKGADALDRRPQLAAALAAAKSRQVLRPGLEARPALARCRVRRRPDGAARAVHRRRTRPRCRSLHAAPLRRAGREGAAADLGTDQGRAGGPKGGRRQARQPDQHPRSRRERARFPWSIAADERARSLLPLLRALRAEGTISIGAITALNERKVPPPRGERWHAPRCQPTRRAQKLAAVASPFYRREYCGPARRHSRDPAQIGNRRGAASDRILPRAAALTRSPKTTEFRADRGSQHRLPSPDRSHRQPQH